MDSFLMFSSLFSIFAIFVISLLSGILVIKFCRKFNLFLDPLSNVKIQSFHKEVIPRAGGIGIYLVALFSSYFTTERIFFVVLSFLPMFFYGLYEDLKGNTPQKVRLLIILFSSFLAVQLTGLKLENIGFFGIPEYLIVPFTIFAVTGIVSAINFIDGLNGLASGISLITFAIFGISSLADGNSLVALGFFFMVAAISGFFAINFPFGKLFLGDTGAYFLGYILAFSAIKIVNNGTGEISPWFPVAVLAYPIIETLFTIVRRSRRLKNKGIKFFEAERVHLHSLVYKRLTRNNSFASIILLSFFLLNSSISFNLRHSDLACLISFVIQTAVYLYFYQSIINFRVGSFIASLRKQSVSYEQAKEIYQKVATPEELKTVENSVK